MNNMAKDNRGFTLVEILVALGISSVIMLALTTLISSTSRAYRETNSEVNIQSEAQITMNILNNMIIEGSSDENDYRWNTVEATAVYKAYKYLVFTNQASGMTSYVIQYGTMLYYHEVATDDADETADVETVVKATDRGIYLLAEGLDTNNGFAVTINKDSDDQVVNLKIQLNFNLDGKSFSVKNTVTPRNC